MEDKEKFFKKLIEELRLFEILAEHRKREIYLEKVAAHSKWKESQFKNERQLEEIEMLAALEKFYERLAGAIRFICLNLIKGQFSQALPYISKIISEFEKLKLKSTNLSDHLKTAESLIFWQNKNKIPSA